MNTSRREELIEGLCSWCAAISKTRGDACISVAASLIQSPTSYRLFTSTPDRALEKRVRDLDARPSFAGMVDELANWLCDAGFTHEADDIRAKCAKMQHLAGNVSAGSGPDRVFLRRKADELRRVLERVMLRQKERRSQSAPSSANRQGGESDEARNEKVTSLKPSVKNAYFAYEYAKLENDNRELEDREAYDWLKKGGLTDCDELQGYQLPHFETFARQLREARKALGENKHTRRYKRSHGRSVVLRRDIER
jgi:hypothetical protein